MFANHWLQIRNWICAVIGVIVILALGCKSGSQNAPVNAGKARETLRTALESWKKGDAATALQSAQTPIYIIDPEWQSGAKLVDFEIQGDGEEKDAHLFCKVKITVRNANGKDIQQEVTFIVSTAPNLTVSRKIF
jgi:hypothetical protein